MLCTNISMHIIKQNLMLNYWTEHCTLDKILEIHSPYHTPRMVSREIEYSMRWYLKVRRKCKPSGRTNSKFGENCRSQGQTAYVITPSRDLITPSRDVIIPYTIKPPRQVLELFIKKDYAELAVWDILVEMMKSEEHVEKYHAVVALDTLTKKG